MIALRSSALVRAIAEQTRSRFAPIIPGSLRSWENHVFATGAHLGGTCENTPCCAFPAGDLASH